MFFSKANKVKVAQAAFNHQNTEKPRKDLDPWIPGTAGNTTSTVEISISCRNLADKDILSKSDPMVVVYNRPPGSRSWIQFMRTEVIEDDLNPDFATKATMEYRFEQVQQIRFEVYDIDSETVKLTRQDNIGFVDVTLGQIVSAGEEGLIMELLSLKPSAVIGNDKPNGTIILTAEELSSEKDEVFLKLSGTNIGKWSGFLPPKTFFSVSKMNEARRYFVVHRSKGSRGTNPAYLPLRISLRTLCNGDRERELRIELFQKKFRGALVHCGQVNTCLTELLRYGPEDKLQLQTPTGATMNSFLRVLACAVNPVSTFVDFMQSGTQIHCCFAIDFTCSNGDPSDSQSLHYISQQGGHQPNPYEQAIQAVGTILKDYDTSSSFPCYGFGARIPPKGDISYDFFVTLAKSPNCLSVPGVLEAYRSCVQKIQLFGPTNFAPVIRAISEVASKTKPGENYYILVILTDGVITDINQTKKAIVTASHLPMSIVVIGVGEADFDVMEELDGDAVRVTYKRKVAARDIVQFVAYRSARSWMAATGECTGTEKIAHDYDNDVAAAPPPPPTEYDEDGDPIEVIAPVVIPENTPAVPEAKMDKTHRLAQSQLAQEVLAEIPEQITGYMRMKGVLPNMITKQSVQADAFALMENPEEEPPPEVV